MIIPHVVARYRCSESFLATIPQVLSDRGFSVSVGSWIKAPAKDTKEFGFTISQRDCSVDLTGGFLEDGQPAFLLATQPTWKMWGFGKRNAFYQRVHEALLGSGVEVWYDYAKRPNPKK